MEITFNVKEISSTLDEIKARAEACKNQIQPRGIKRHTSDFTLYSTEGILLLNGTIFKDFKELASRIYEIKNGAIRLSCNPHPYKIITIV